MLLNQVTLLENLKKISEKCRKLLGIEFPKENEKGKLSRTPELNNFYIHSSNNFFKCYLNQNDYTTRSLRRIPKMKREII